MNSGAGGGDRFELCDHGMPLPERTWTAASEEIPDHRKIPNRRSDCEEFKAQSSAVGFVCGQTKIPTSSRIVRSRGDNARG